MVWGLAGFIVFTVAPGLGLPPELPGMPAAELGPRQVWWIGTVLATAGGLALIAYGRGPALGFLGAALLVIPHLVGAPQPPSHETGVPEDLHHRFVVAVTVTNLVFWVLLGYAVAVLRPRFAADLGTPQPRLA
jgi:cobalt transporter subunit CbtA